MNGNWNVPERCGVKPGTAMTILPDLANFSAFVAGGILAPSRFAFSSCDCDGGNVVIASKVAFMLEKLDE